MPACTLDSPRLGVLFTLWWSGRQSKCKQHHQAGAAMAWRAAEHFSKMPLGYSCHSLTSGLTLLQNSTHLQLPWLCWVAYNTLAPSVSLLETFEFRFFRTFFVSSFERKILLTIYSHIQWHFWIPLFPHFFRVKFRAKDFVDNLFSHSVTLLNSPFSELFLCQV